jgi:hypothetical protein
MPTLYPQRTATPRRSPAVTWLTTVFILALAFALFVLVKSAVSHHFFSGERLSTDASVSASAPQD